MIFDRLTYLQGLKLPMSLSDEVLEIHRLISSNETNEGETREANPNYKS